MAIPFQHKIRRVNSVIKLKESLGAGNDTLVAWWYAGFYKNPKDASQPHVLVIFRKISPGMASDEVVPRRVPMVALGQVRIGSIWKDDRCQAEASFELSQFSVNFSADNWRFTSLNQARQRREAPPFPTNTYKLQYENDRNWLVEFDLQNGGKLLIPCMEFFARCYGRSGELKRVLATYPWKGQADTAASRLYAPLDRPDEPGKWQVRLRRRLVNGDVVFLAHAKYDPYTEQAAKSIYAQIETNHDPKLIIPAFVKVSPWFQGPAEIKVEGIRFNDGKSFLALRVVGMSDPNGELVLRSRENSGDAENPAPEGSPVAWAGAPERVLLKYPDVIDLTGDLEPDQDGGAIEVQDADFEVLGNARKVINVRATQATSRAGPRGDSQCPTAISGGEAYGGGKGVGYASTHAKPVFESHGALRDMWNAMLSLHQSRPELIHAVSWYTFAQGFSSAPTPELISLEPFTDDDVVTAEARRFPYMDPSVPSLRGVLVVRLTVADGYAYIVEIMRRPRKVTAEDGGIKDTEEAFQGLVFRLRHENQLIPWLRELLAKIRYANGVFKRLTGSCPGIADSFSHRLSTKSTDGALPYEPVVLNALAKLNGPKKLASSGPV